jgi:hypothetical protein
MWIIGGAKTNTRMVKDGRVAEGRCGNCEAVTTFRECDVKDTVEAFFVELFDTSQRRMVCVECGEDHDVEEFFRSVRVAGRPSPPASKPAESPSLWDRIRGGARSLAARSDEKEACDKQVAGGKKGGGGEDDIDAELAALKRKLGKKDAG